MITHCEGFIVVLIYIGDIVIGSNNKELIDPFKASLQSHIQVEGLGRSSLFLRS